MHLVDTTLFFSPTSGGVRRYLTAKHDWLRAHTPHRHSLLVPGAQTRLVPDGISTIAGWKIPGTFNYRLPLSPRRWTAMLAALEPDLIEVGDAFHPAWSAAHVAQSRRVPLVAFFHSNLPRIIAQRFGAGIGRGVGRYLRHAYQRFDLVLAPSHHVCDYLATLGVHRTMLQPLGVDTAVFSPQRRTLDLRRDLGLPEATRLLVYAGRFSVEKNIPVLHAAMRRLGKPYHLLLIGGGRHARPAANITVLPYRRDSIELASWIASCDALVHAGTAETFGLVLLEAMACGRPVVATHAGAVPEYVDESVGMLAAPHDAASMADAIAALYQRDLAALGRAACARVLQRYTWTQALRLQLAHYASVSSHGMPAAARGLAGTEDAQLELASPR
jgi:alpha-1,6-mannosyltransferase